MYFYDRMFNPNYVNQNYFMQQQNQIAQYNFQQDKEVSKAVKAMHDLCDAVKHMDDSHQQQAFFACLSTMAQEFGWQS